MSELVRESTKKSVVFEIPVRNIDYEDISEIFSNDEKTFHLYIGNAKVAKDVEKLQGMKIKNIVQVTFGKPPKPDLFKYCIVSVSDLPMQGIMSHFQRTNKFIGEAIDRNENVLVHCTEGVSRSSSIVIAFMMYKFKMSFKNAYSYVKSKRKICKPNKGFIYQLKEYEKELLNKKEVNND